jgi:hypothetical protein
MPKSKKRKRNAARVKRQMGMNRKKLERNNVTPEPDSENLHFEGHHDGEPSSIIEVCDDKASAGWLGSAWDGICYGVGQVLTIIVVNGFYLKLFEGC